VETDVFLYYSLFKKQFKNKLSALKINYRAVFGSLLLLAAIALLPLASCSRHSDSSKNQVSENKNIATNQANAAIPESHNTPLQTQPQEQILKTHYSSTPSAEYRTISVVEYYEQNYYFADEKIELDKKVIAFIKNPPLVHKIDLYKHYKKVKKDYLAVKRSRLKLDRLEDQYYGRNGLENSIRKKQEQYLELEAQLFYQLEKIVYYSRESYINWQTFLSQGHESFPRLEKDSVNRSVKTAALFQGFSNAIDNYTQIRK
jgi:hypothetical protein